MELGRAKRVPVQEPNKPDAIAQILPVGDSLSASLAMVVKPKYPTNVITTMKQDVGKVQLTR